MEENTTSNIAQMWKTVWAKRKIFYRAWAITFVVSAVIIFSIPRYWQSRVTLSPEDSAGSMGALGSLASSFGFDVGAGGGEDAIHPELYPDVVKSQQFIVGLFDVQIQTSDNRYDETYYTYMAKHVRKPWWKIIKGKLVKLTYYIRKPQKGGRPNSNANEVDPFWLNKQQMGIVNKMRDNIKCSFDIKTNVVTILVTDQDKLVAALIADSVCAHLQAHVTNYRTHKARLEKMYYESMTEQSYESYQQAANDYIRFIDSHSGMSLERYKAEAQQLDREQETRWTAYESFKRQSMAADAKLQEQTPVFAIINTPTVPEIPAGPKRVRFIFSMLVLVSLIIGILYTRDYWKQLLKAQ